MSRSSSSRRADRDASSIAAASAGGDVVHPETEIPDGERAVLRCPYCDRPFRRERPGTLHVGQVHGDECSPAERDAYEAALDDEADDLFVYHLRIVAALSLTYTVAVLGYMVVLGAS